MKKIDGALGEIKVTGKMEEIHHGYIMAQGGRFSAVGDLLKVDGKEYAIYRRINAGCVPYAYKVRKVVSDSEIGSY